MRNKMKFQLRVILSNILITFVIMTFVVIFFYQTTTKALMEQSLEDFSTLSLKTATQFESIIYHMDRTALQIAANPTIVRYFMEVDQDNDNYFIEHPLHAQEVVKILNSYNFKEDAFLRIALYNNFNDFVYTANCMTTTTAIDHFFATSSFYNVLNEFNIPGNFYVFRGPQADNLNDSTMPSPNYFSFIREIKDYYTNNSAHGYVEVQQSVEVLNQLFSDLGQKTYAVIFDHQNQMIYNSPNLDQVNKTSLNLLTDFILTYPYDTNLQEHGDYYSLLNPIKQGNLTLLFLKNKHDILAPLNQFKLSLIFATIAMIIVTVISNIFIINRLSRPLVSLGQSIKQININNLKLNLDEEHETDELIQINKTFNQMLSQLQSSIQRQIHLETNALKSHLYALQSQMNPHFIHNILAIISMEAIHSGNLKTAQICTKLCKMLKFTASMGDGVCTLKEELLNAENYMELMKERYEDLFEFNIVMDESVTDCIIPKMIIQPICENCFQHGFKTVEPIWRIEILAYEENDMWFILINDNGSGFSDTYLSDYTQMMDNLTMENVEDAIKQTKIGGLCMINIYMRLKIYFNDEFIFKISNEEHGASVLLGGKRHV